MIICMFSLSLSLSLFPFKLYKVEMLWTFMEIVTVSNQYFNLFQSLYGLCLSYFDVNLILLYVINADTPKEKCSFLQVFTQQFC